MSPRTALAAWTAVVLAAGAGLPRLELRTDGHALVPAGSPAVAADAEVRERFGLRDPVVVVVETERPEGIFHPEVLRRVRDLSERLQALDGVDPLRVTSLATETRNRVYSGTLRFRPFLDPLPETPELMARFRSDLAEIGLLDGTLVGHGGRATAILVGIDPPAGAGDRTELVRRIADVAAPFAGGTESVSVVGAPVAEALLGLHILADLATLLPAAIAIIALVLWLACRRLWAVALGLAEVAACLAFTFGLMGWLGVPVFLPTAVLPVILTTVGLADEIHILWHHQRELEAPGAEGASAVGRTMAAMRRPVVVTSLTTGLAFLSFLGSPIAAVRWFGLFAAVGVGFCLGFSLSVMPAALTLLGAGRLRHAASAATAGGGRLAAALAPALRRPGWVLGLIAAATLAVGAGASRLVVQDSWLDGFAPGSPFRRATERFNAAFHGAHLLHAHLAFSLPDERVPEDAFGERGPLLSPEIVAALGRFERAIAERPEVGGVLGPYAHLEAINAMWPPGHTARVPMDDVRGISRLINRFEMGRGEHRRREVIGDGLDRTVVTVFLKHANYRDTARLTAAIRELADELLAPHGARLEFAGDVAVSQAMIPAVVRTQVSSLLLALLGALALLWALTRSLPWALLTVAPVALAVTWAFGAMGWLGIPLGVATSMFCAITLGVGVDYAVHLVAARDRARAAGEARPAAAAIASAGPAIVSDALAIGLGFGLLTLSRVPANARLGLLVALALGTACVFTLLGLGAALAAPWRPAWRLRPALRRRDQAAPAPAPSSSRRSSSSPTTPASK